MIRPDDRAEPDSDPGTDTNLEVRIDEAKGAAKKAQEAVQRADAKVDALAKLLEERFAMLFGDVATIMGSGIRLEKGLDAVRADVAVIKGEMVATKLRVGRLDNENESNREAIRESRDSLRVVANDVLSTQSRLSDKAAADKLDRARMEERYRALKSDISELKKDVSASGQHAAVGEAFARKSLESVDEIKGLVVEEKREEKAEEREVKKERREDKRHLWKWALGLVGALVLASASYAISAHFGAQNAPHLPAPAAAH